jgi:hypothetical protein
VQHGDREQADRAGEVEQVAHARCGEHRAGVAHVGRRHRRERVAVEHRRGRRDGHRLVVDVGDARGGAAFPGDLVDVADGGDAGAEVEELVDALRLAEPDSPAEERPVGPYGLADPRHRRAGLVGCGAVGGEVVGAAEVVVVHPRCVRHVRVDCRQFREVGHACRCCPVG